ncbi:MAG: hypothetical protein Q9199_007462, partial [Rusavskia elegans]
MRLLSDLFVISFILLPRVWAQEDFTTIIPSSTEQDPVTGVETAPFPAATGPHCLQPRGPSDPPSSDISQALGADDSVTKACNVENQSIDTIGQLFVISYAWHAYCFNISHNANIVSRPIARPNQCPDAFNSILEQCVTGAGNFWGGYTQGGIANYSITNHVYPENALVQPDQSGPTTTDTAPFATTTGFEPLNTRSGTAVNQTTLDADPNPNSYSRNYINGPVKTDNFSDESATDIYTTSWTFKDDSNIDTQELADQTTSNAADPKKTNDGVMSTLAQGNSIPLPPGATVMSKTMSGIVVIQTFIPTIIPQLASLLTTTIITSVNAQKSAFTYLVGPGGVAWTPLSPPSAGPQIQPTDAPFQSTTGTTTNAAIGVTTGTIASAGSTLSQRIATRTIADLATTGGVLPIIATPVDVQAAIFTSVDSAITENTAILTGDGTHTWGLYPFFHGGPRCLWCPPGLDNGGLVLWGITRPGEYDNIQPPIPNIVGPMPNIVVNSGLVPSANGNPEDEDEDEEEEEPSNTRPQETQPSKTQPTTTQTSEISTGICTASTVTGACERPSAYRTTLAPVTEPSKGLGRGPVVLPGGGGRTTGASRTSTAFAESSTVRADTNAGTRDPSALITTQMERATNTDPDTLITSRGAGSSSILVNPAEPPSTMSRYVPPAWQCPNDGVRQNAPGCPTPTTSTGGPLRCSTGSNIGAATFNPATWCGCNDGKVYPTIPDTTSDYCAYKTVPTSTIRPTQAPNPYPFTTTNMQNGEVVACATSSVDTAKSSTACEGSSTVVSTVTSIAEAAVPTANCEFWDQVLYWNIEVYNINGWAGDDGNSLKTQEKGCGGLTGWEWHVDNERYQHAYFNLPFTIKKGCVERAIKSAGGPGGLSCKGHGLKKRSDKRSIQGSSNQAHQRLRSKSYGKRSEHRFTHEYLGEKSINAANPNISSRSLVPRAHTDAWNKYAPKGIQYYNEWKNRAADQDDKADLCNFDKTYDFSQDPLAVTGPYDPIKPYINGAKGQTYTNFRWHWPKGPTNAASAIFWNNISPVDNVIIAFSNDRGGDEEEGEDPSPDNWSDMLWWLWLRAVGESGDKAALSQIFRYNVDNDASKEILEEILGDKQDEVVTLEADDTQSQDNGFWALLGCPNGTGMIHMVGDHKKALGEKGIE